MTILVTGGSGQVAQAILRHAGALPLRVVGRPEVDLENPASVTAIMEAVRPSLVINTAAWTAVDAAEANRDSAWRTNALGPLVLARDCARLGAVLIHVSTDYVFDGAKTGAYVETDATNPAATYGLSKLAGEHAVLAHCPRALVVRTAWVYATHGKNFVLTMLNAGRTRPQLRVVADQIGCPSNADDLGRCLLALARRIETGWQDSYAGIYHLAGAGEVSWHGFATAIFAAASAHGYTPPRIEPIPTADYPTPVQRPANSVLDCGKITQRFGVTMPAWEDSLRPAVADILKGGA